MTQGHVRDDDGYGDGGYDDDGEGGQDNLVDTVIDVDGHDDNGNAADDDDCYH